MVIGYRLSAIRSDELHPQASKAPWRWLTRTRDGELELWAERPIYDVDLDAWLDPYGADHCPVPYELGDHIGRGPVLYLIAGPREHVKDTTDELTPGEIERCNYLLRL